MASFRKFGALFLLLCFVFTVQSVDRDNFKTCEQSSFCRRCRKVEAGKSPYQLLSNTISQNYSTLFAELFNKDTGVYYVLQLTALEENTFRLHINEKNPLKPRYEVEHALQGVPNQIKLTISERTDDHTTVTNGPSKIVIYHIPLKIDSYFDDQLVISANARGLMRFEHLRTKVEKPAEGEEGAIVEEVTSEYPGDGAESDPGAWEENFKSHHDAKPNGPEAIALDFSFPGAEFAYGIPQHADSFALKSTKGIDPYRLYNLDVFEYEVNERMALYGSIPVLYAHGKELTSGVFWHNAAETWVDIRSSTDNNVVESIVNFVSGGVKKPQVDAHFISESGVIDVFFLLGPSPLDTFRQYTTLTGVTPLPQLFTLGYHQCRWNYNDEQDVIDVNRHFDQYNISMDVMWLDIEYTDNKKYFTWDSRKFSKPLEMIENLTNVGRKLVVIIDPHIKRDNSYFIHNDATDNGYYVKHADGKDYEGWCWPGSSSYLDFFNPTIREYFGDQYGLDKFHGTTNDVYIWNDMNEPSVFNGPEITMPKDLIHYGGWEHRDVHNINGLMFTSVTYDALIKRSQGTRRPFVLTRSHFAGSQRSAAVWTGDNTAEWSHLRISYPMCLSTAVAGMSFCGADIGGFFKNPDTELFTRWNQAGIWLPFFRQHAHIETKRREPWLFDDDTTRRVRDAFALRYSYLPLWYTLFREHEIKGYPVIRPLWAHYPAEFNCFTIDDQLLVGDAILVRPVMEASVSEVTVYFPGEGKDKWYDINTMEEYSTPGNVRIPVNIDKTPVYQRSGTIVPRKMRNRRSTVAMKDDPYTLVVIGDDMKKASGTLYIDDETSFEYRQGKYIYLQLFFDRNVLSSKYIDKLNKFETKSWLERVNIVNAPQNVKSAKLITKSGNSTLEVNFNPGNKVLTIRKPAVNMGEEWSIELIR
ncbi:hypothetical protein PV327_002670 [Microctonus hyperodae]|uniref:Glucosidase II subunit alpha n=1 Tax=Microctonus hyperodae TaxID=165561 RepID=A0AA39FG21_MICHY|nr:hypothetical protein PV327_002670 [Microctonus hyperodae]